MDAIRKHRDAYISISDLGMIIASREDTLTLALASYVFVSPTVLDTIFENTVNHPLYE
jgi:hypothetical protein